VRLGERAVVSERWRERACWVSSALARGAGASLADDWAECARDMGDALIGEAGRGMAEGGRAGGLVRSEPAETMECAPDTLRFAFAPVLRAEEETFALGLMVCSGAVDAAADAVLVCL
jgi:hypothetical protein